MPDKDDRCPKEPGPRENQGCPWPRATCEAPPACPRCAEKPNQTLAIAGKLGFRWGRAVLTKSSDAALDGIARTLRETPAIRVLEVQGHTDDEGTARANLKLSQQRADVVRAYLVKKGGIEPGRVVARGYGSARPLRVVTKGQMNKREIDAARAINRRVEFVVVEGSEGR